MQQIAITIDTEFHDRPAADPLGALDELLQILAHRGVPATFFVVGSWAGAYPDRVSAIAAAGHVVGNHGYAHCDLTKLTNAGIVGDLGDCDGKLAAVGVAARPWFRAPYGSIGAGGAARGE